MYALFNLANKGSAIEAKGPYIRLLALNMSLSYCVDYVSENKNLETRTWPMSKATNSSTELNWRSVSSLNLLDLEPKAQHEALEREYALFNLKVDQWNNYREKLSKDVFEASQSKIRRPYHQLFAERLLEKNVTVETTNETTNAESRDDSEKAKVPELVRENEVRGQTWAVIAIVGDAEYEIKREAILDALGLNYFKECIKVLETNNDYNFSSTNVSDPNVQDYINTKIDFEDKIIQAQVDSLILDAKKALDALRKEPLVSFFAASEDASELLKKSEDLAKLECLKHADIAVVRMYSWLSLSSSTSARSRSARDPRAQDFFTKMRPQ